MISGLNEAGGCLPEICISNVSLNKFLQCTVDNFVEVHYFLLLWGRIRTKVKVLDDHVSYVLSSGKCRPLNNLTAVTIYQIWYTVSSCWNKHVTKPVVTKPVTKAWDPASLAGSDDFYAGQISNVVSCDATIILQLWGKTYHCNKAD